MKITEKPQEPEGTGQRRNWRSRSRPANEEQKTERNDLDLVNGEKLELDVGGDLRVCEDDSGKGFMGIHYHERLPENYRKFLVEPTKPQKDDYRALLGTVRCHSEHVDEEGQTNQKCVRTFDVEIEEEAVRAFFYVEPEPEPEPEVKKEEVSL